MLSNSSLLPAARILVISMMTGLVIGCNPAPRAAARIEHPAVVLPAAVKELTPDEAEKLISSTPDLVILDMRQEGEVQKEGRIAGARNYDYLHGPPVLAELAKLDHAKPCLVYCEIGGRAKLTAVEMRGMGFQNITLLKGGLNAWLVAGKPVVK